MKICFRAGWQGQDGPMLSLGSLGAVPHRAFATSENYHLSGKNGKYDLEIGTL